jgi:very-short-patch-repair endonuclease
MHMHRLELFASTHHGVVTRSAAIDAGVSERSWSRACSTGQLDLLFPRVARIPGSPRSREQQVLAAVLAAGAGAMASHRSSAHIWGASRPIDDPIDLIVDRRQASARLGPGVRVHHPRDLDELRPVVRLGIPTTNPMRMLLDLGAVDPIGVLPALDRMVTLRVVTPTAVAAFLDRHRRRGRHGVKALAAALNVWQIDSRDVHSALEVDMNRLLRRFGLPPAIFHAVVAGYQVDFLFADTQVVIECDGHESHGLDRDQFEFDRQRDAELMAAGFVVVHVTWTQVHRQPAEVAARLCEVLRVWAPHVMKRTVDRVAS